jgi:Gp157 protein
VLSNNLEPLWQIEDELEALVDSLDTCPDELRPELEQRIGEYISKEAVKVDRLAAVLTQRENVQSNAKTEIERLRARGESAQRAGKRLERYILEILRKRDGRPLRGANVTLSARHSESLVITDSNLVPDCWKRSTVTVDIPKDPIKRALKAGQEILGVALQQGEYLVRK